MPGCTALLHGHCHQKAFATAAAAVKALELIPTSTSRPPTRPAAAWPSFGYEVEHYEMSLRIGELGVLPACAPPLRHALLAACGTSCRHQIADAAQREARHIVRLLDEASRAYYEPKR